MFRQPFPPVLNRISAVASVILLSASVAWSSSYKVLHSFSGRLARNPSSGLVLDKAGNAYGTTSAGGFHGGKGGTIYQLSSKTGFSVIYGFSGPDGLQPQGNLAIDAAGNLYGTTVYGGAFKTGCNNQGCGTVFRLSPPTNGDAWTQTVLYSFSGGDDGSNPQAGVMLDSAGNLYGTTEFGGDLGFGTVFELSPGPGNTWSETVLYGMEQGGAGPLGGLVLDQSGNLFGTTCCLGPEKGGTVFELSPQFDGSWTYTLVYAFDGFNGSQDGIGPEAGLILDAAGNLFGTTAGGGKFGFGTVFELTKNGGGWTESVLYSFAGGSDGATPQAGLVLDASGLLYGTTFAGGTGCGTQGCGTVFALTPSQNEWTERLFRFPADGHLGLQPASPLSLDENGHLYGTTTRGGSGVGVIFKITP
ncbi:MAG: hypothetical protein LAO09_18930 [Acidobacteriia bacterium]|nr:hypothetical protein [Terriglobia bacterium]